MVQYIKNTNELMVDLKDIIDFMISSSISYDNGHEGECKRMSVSIRILVRDTTKSSSLLSQLGFLDNMLFYDSATPFHPDNPLSSNCLTMIRIATSSEKVGEINYVAPLDWRQDRGMIIKKMKFNRWWNTQVVLKDTNKNEFHRKNIILTMADQDGGAHVDPTLDGAYAKLTRFNSLCWRYIDNTGNAIELSNPVPASIRQINHEMIKTLQDYMTSEISLDDKIFNEFNKYNKHCLQVVEKHITNKS